ncbi:hypothetical protein NIES37_39360 [Tolypothrix tenuis PCC 7101]|uniref:Uncharacterized protein n=1 Tax=Tolypothrix tenuis PCC 7101 TaxID=231146 RepID=A0A1Z4N2L5_9CYAN|nr:hypothetical protein NIES37_39360 [Tolypothrix tenuis PCC 7101]BAZ76125.1 hypothetical protein NIES50_47230 [Aulosira laxa NIES-50]
MVRYAIANAPYNLRCNCRIGIRAKKLDICKNENFGMENLIFNLRDNLRKLNISFLHFSKYAYQVLANI